jgi:hypothetical protein
MNMLGMAVEFNTKIVYVHGSSMKSYLIVIILTALCEFVM